MLFIDGPQIHYLYKIIPFISPELNKFQIAFFLAK